MSIKALFVVGVVAIASVCVCPRLAGAQVNVLTYHNDNARTGQNIAETILTSTNVDASTFGKLFSYPVDGYVYAQPLYVSNLQIPGRGTHNVVFVATEHDSVYAFDADDSAVGQLWQVSFINPANGITSVPAADVGTNDISPEIGITGTPVIDRASGTLYVVGKTKEDRQGTTHYVLRLHALDITTGAEVSRGPVVIADMTLINGNFGYVSGPKVPGNGGGSVGGESILWPLTHMNRPGLLLMNGVVYTTWGSHGDNPTTHGWILGHDAATLSLASIFNTTPDGTLGTVWMSGAAPAVDADGNIYVSTGNGSFVAGAAYGNSLLKFLTGATLNLSQYFTPWDQDSLNTGDLDFGAGGVVVLPDQPGTHPHLVVAATKTGRVYLIDRDNLGGYQRCGVQCDDVVQVIPDDSLGSMFGIPAYFNGSLYFQATGDVLKAYRLSNGALSPVQPQSATLVGFPGSVPSVSANGTTNGIVWIVRRSSTSPSTSPAVLHAFDATNLANELYNTTQRSTDQLNKAVKFVAPTIANGKVYIGTQTSVDVLGLRPVAAIGVLNGTANGSSASADLDQEGQADWIHWGDSVLNRKAGGGNQFSDASAVGVGTIATYVNDPRPLSWSSGTPTATSSNNTNGFSTSGIGSGLTFTAPADTTLRTVVVHAGGVQSAGTFTAHLSDGSAPDFVETTTSSTGLYDRNYTLTYKASAPGQTLVLTWTMASGTGAVNLSAAALSVPADSIQATAGTPQSASVNTAFATLLQATVRDAQNNPLGGVTVTFTAPASGATATFGGSFSASAVTNSNGVATAPTLTANGTSGSYTVTATAPGVSTAASFSLTNIASTLGSLFGSADSLESAVNLTAEGWSDWIHWGTGGVNRKSTGGTQLSTITMIGSASSSIYADDPRPMSWTDGTPTTANSGDFSGYFVFGIGNGFRLTAPADTTLRRIVVHVGGFQAAGTLTAHLSDGSAPDYTETTSAWDFQFGRNYTLTYRAAAAGMQLQLTWVVSASNGAFGNVNISAASLSLPTQTVTATQGTPQSVAINTDFPIALQATVRDANNNPLAGVTVTFTAPVSGASATFSGSTTATAVTNSSGVATAPTLTANGLTGSYAVVASAPSVPVSGTFALTNTVGAPASVTATAGSSQTTFVNTAFATALQATVWDASSNPVAGVTVTFTAPASGASATFSGAATAITNSNGVATAPTLTANGTTGSYTFTATVAGVATPANFSLTNATAPTGGSLTGSVNTSIAAMNLSTEGPTDWIHWGTTVDRKATGGSQISTVTLVGSGSLLVYNDDPRPISWTGGTPTASSTNNPNGLFVFGLANGVTFTAPADTTLRTLVVHVGGFRSAGRLVAHLSDGSSGDFVDTSATGNDQYDCNYTLTYKAASAGQTLRITWTTAATSGTNANVSISAAALNTASTSTIAATAGTPQSATVNTVFATALQATVRDASNNPVGGVTVTFTAPASGASARFSGSATATAVTNSSGVATAPTLTANGAVGSYTVTATVPGTATPASFSLTNTAGTPASITATAGTPQSATIITAFATALQATVRDASNNLVAGVTVTFTAPASGASATFSGSTTATATTNSSGVATAPTLTANGTTGSYTVTATVTGVATAANFSLTNTVGTPASITATAGTPQSATINTAFATALQATVRDGASNPVAGVTVTFTAPTSGARGTFNGASTATATTNSSGVATAPTLTANGTTGSYTVTATVAGVATPASFSLTNTAGAPASITATAGTPQSATINTAFATALQATVRDASNNPVAGVTVTFTAPASGASASFSGSTTATATTNSSGVATAPTLTANGTTGSYTVTATATGVATAANFSLTNTVGTPASITATAGTPQSATINTAFATALQATVWDASSNPVAGVTVTFRAPASGASASFSGSATATGTTNASGIATAPPLTANGTTGSYTVTATVAGVATPANFSLTNTVGTPASITATAGTPQSATVNTAFTTALQATVRDGASNPVAGVTVTFTAPTSGARGTFNGASTATATTNSSGVATAPTLTANGTTGSYTVTATVAGVATPANFSLTNIGTPASITATAGTPQSAIINTTFATALQATVRDANNNPVPGVTVTFTAPSSGASARFSGSAITAIVVTNSNGVATAPALRANNTVGSYTVTASVTGVATPASFNLTNTRRQGQ